LLYAAGAVGFLIFNHTFNGPDLYGALSFFETMPSRQSLRPPQTICRHAPRRAPHIGFRDRSAEVFRSAALRSTYGLRRRSSPLSITRSKAQAEALSSPIRIQPDHLRVDNCGAVNAACVPDDQRISLGPVGSGDRVGPHPTIADMDLQPIAVMLQFMRPARAGWGLLGDDWLARMNESGRRV
jgi:hypothetical protein